MDSKWPSNTAGGAVLIDVRMVHSSRETERKRENGYSILFYDTKIV